MMKRTVFVGLAAAGLFTASLCAQERPAAFAKGWQRALQPKAAPSGLPAGADVFVVTVGAWEFFPAWLDYSENGGLHPANVVAPYTMSAFGGPTRDMLANVHLPTGVVIHTIELDYCDDTQALDVSVELLDCLDDAGGPGGCNTIGTAASSGGGGCGYATSDPIGVLIDNTNHDYILHMPLVSAMDYGVRGVKIYYSLVVSPAPATASFNDVPTSDPAFQFVEAFSRAGITVGCSAAPPLYCPDGFVTRRQMAVFFAKALGLHWPG